MITANSIKSQSRKSILSIVLITCLIKSKGHVTIDSNRRYEFLGSSRLVSEVCGLLYVDCISLDYFFPKSKKFVWSESCERNFKMLKDRFTYAPWLTLLEGTKGFVV